MREKISLQCHQKLEQGLERQHTKLQKTLEELRDYQKQHEKWAKMNSKVIIILIIVITTTLLSEDHKAAKCQVNAVQAPLEMRVASRLSYEKYTFLTEGGGVYYHILATSTRHNLFTKQDGRYDLKGATRLSITGRSLLSALSTMWTSQTRLLVKQFTGNL